MNHRVVKLDVEPVGLLLELHFPLTLIGIRSELAQRLGGTDCLVFDEKVDAFINTELVEAFLLIRQELHLFVIKHRVPFQNHQVVSLDLELSRDGGLKVVH